MFLELIYRFDRPQKNVQNYPVATTNYMKQHWRIQSGGGGDRGSGPPLKNHKNIGFLSNAGPDPLKSSQHLILCTHRPASETALNGVSLAGR